ncbi:MAG: M23 family metallopeptidase [Acidimicrobiia bacterium]|nr:M23 family metallopeptidase [Acidimicrobiia bacterium]
MSSAGGSIGDRSAARRLLGRRRAVVGAVVGALGLLCGLLAPGRFADAAGPMPRFEIPFPCGETWWALTRDGHKAVDWNRIDVDDTGLHVVAAADGIAEIDEEPGGWGSYVLIDHGGGWWTVYAHLQSAGRVSGPVRQGQVIGRVGATGNAQGEHLHYEQWKDVVKQPVLYASGAPLQPGTTWPGTSYTSRNACGGSTIGGAGSVDTTPPTAAPTTAAPAPPATIAPAPPAPASGSASATDESPSPLGPASFVATAPRRLSDTRDIDRPLRPGEVLPVPVAGGSRAPYDAAAVALNVTAVEPDGAGYLTVYPCDRPRPLASNLNYSPGATVANLSVVQPSDYGWVCIYTHRATHVLVDLQGWYVPGAAEPAGPLRLVDTRDRGLPLAPGEVVALAAGSGAMAAAINLTVTQAAEPGFLTAWPCDRARPNASNLNFSAGDTVANLALGQLAADGTICVRSSASAHLVVDLLARHPAGGGQHATVPRRLVDTRDGTGLPAGMVPAGVLRVPVSGRTADSVPAGAAAAVLNVTVIDPSSEGFVSVFACGTAVPATSNVNYRAGQTVANVAVAPLDAAGYACLFVQKPMHLVIDQQGWVAGS